MISTISLKELIPQGLRSYLRWLRTCARNPGVSLAQSCVVGDNCHLSKPCAVGPDVTIFESSVGRYTYLAQGAILTTCNVGSFCSIGPYAILGGGVHPTRDWVSSSPLFYSTRCKFRTSFASQERFQEFIRTNIGNDVWVGAGAVILPGTRVGHGAIVGAGAVVSREVQPFQIVVGVPAKPIRARFSQEQIEKLLEIAWWNRNDDWLALRTEDFQSVERFLQQNYQDPA